MFVVYILFKEDGMEENKIIEYKVKHIAVVRVVVSDAAIVAMANVH